MPQRQPNCPFNHPVYVCGFEGCRKACTTRGGLKQHMQSVHQPSCHLRRPFNAEPEGPPFDYGDGFNDVQLPPEDPEGVQRPGARKVMHHPILDGTGPFDLRIHSMY